MGSLCGITVTEMVFEVLVALKRVGRDVRVLFSNMVWAPFEIALKIYGFITVYSKGRILL
ncbi:MAG TPA: hypothetical protein DCY20_10305 [Firmicutes bacterium]|nr:hypothetical protein [Bacillota bacterium]